MRLPTALSLAAALTLTACAGDSTSPLAATRFLLQSVDGRPLPAPVDSTPHFSGGMLLERITHRSIAFLSGSKALYTRASDVVERLQDGTIVEWTAKCFSIESDYTRQNDRLVLIVPAPPVFPIPGQPTPPIPQPEHDTLTVIGDKLVHHYRHTTPAAPVQLEYHPVTTNPPDCASL